MRSVGNSQEGRIMARESSLGVLERPTELTDETGTARASRATCRVLIVDDHPLVLSLVSHLLRHAEYVVEGADGGPEGIRQLRAAPPDLVLTDLCMPEASGWDVARAAKTLQPPVPVILMTGSGEAVNESPEGRVLVEAVLLKPFGVKELLDAVGGIIGNGRALSPNVTRGRSAVPSAISEAPA
jgi:CheY-like chemotaxis protein